MSKYTQIPINPVGNFTTTSEPFSMSNFQTINFFVDTKKENAEISFKVEASRDGGEPENIGFQFIENGGSEITEVSDKGITVTHEGTGTRTWQVTVADRMLSHGEFDSVALVVIESEADAVVNIFALQTQPRYSEGE